MKHRIPFAERILCSPAEAAEALDKGKTTIFAMIAQGRLRTVKMGSRRHVYVALAAAIYSENMRLRVWWAGGCYSCGDRMEICPEDFRRPDGTLPECLHGWLQPQEITP